MSVRTLSPNAHHALRSLGADLRVARLKRRIPMKEFAERVGVSERTVARLEKGDGGVGIGTLAMACMVLGELDRISGFLDAGSDVTGLLMERERLPRRIDTRRRPEAPSGSTDRNPAHSGNDDEEGVGF